MASHLLYLILCLTILCVNSSIQHDEEIRNVLDKLKMEGRISSDVYEDANLDVPGLIRKYGYPFEEHTIVTEDGYILGVHRIPYGRDANNDPTVDRPSVLVMHGILCSSADWVLMGPGTALAYILADAGFDVWLGNSRGNTYSRRHLTLNPNMTLFDASFWQFSWDEMGRIDLPAMVDHILEVTGKESIHYIGHSQGTTEFFVMGSMRPEYNAKIRSMHALAPVAFLDQNKNPFLQAMSPFANDLQKINDFLGVGEFLPTNKLFKWAGGELCMVDVFQGLCSNFLFLLVGGDIRQFNTTMFPVILAHSPAGSSSRQFAHLGQVMANKKFQRYNFGYIRNWQLYRSFTPPDYDLSKVTAPTYLHYSETDVFANPRDVENTFNHLGRAMGLFKINYDNFSHADFMWGIEAKKYVYDRVINLMWAFENSV